MEEFTIRSLPEFLKYSQLYNAYMENEDLNIDENITIQKKNAKFDTVINNFNRINLFFYANNS